MPYSNWNYSRPNWTDETTPPISAVNLADMGRALEKMNATSEQLASVGGTTSNTIGEIVKKIGDIIGEVSTMLDTINGEVI